MKKSYLLSVGVRLWSTRFDALVAPFRAHIACVAMDPDAPLGSVDFTLCIDSPKRRHVHIPHRFYGDPFIVSLLCLLCLSPQPLQLLQPQALKLPFDY